MKYLIMLKADGECYSFAEETFFNGAQLLQTPAYSTLYSTFHISETWVGS